MPPAAKTRLRKSFNLRRTLEESEYTYLGWAFFLPFAMMLLIYIAMQVYPFGRSSVLVLDLNGQYVYFFEALRDFVYGENSLLYSFGRALGGEFMGIYAYYIASPLSYIVALFPKSMILEALFLMFLIKCGLSGLTFGYYIHKTRRASKSATILFSLMYALSAYAIIQQHNTMWIDNLILLPLITYGLEQLITNKKYKLFTLSLALAIFSNFYIGYMSCLYVGIYFFYYYFMTKRSTGEDTFVDLKNFAKALLRVLIFSAIAVGMAAVILFSTYYSLQFGKMEFSTPNFSLFQKFDFLDLFTKFFPGSYDTVRPEGWPFVYCGVLAIILLPIYFISKHISKREKIASGILLLVFLLSFSINTFDMIWHGFQRPNWLNYRYSYMLCFLILVFSFRVFERIQEINTKAVFAVCGIIGSLLLVVQKLDYKNMPDLEAIWVSLICIVTYAIAISCAKKTLFLENTTMIITVLVCLEMVCAGVTGLVALDKDVVISSYYSYHDFMNKFQPLIDRVKDSDDSFYRMEKTEHRKVNDPFALGYRGLSNSTSTLNSDTILFLQNMGLCSKSHWSQYTGGTPVSDSLFALKYLIANSSQEIPLYEPIDSEGNYIAYKNPYALPLAFGVNGKYKDVRFVAPKNEDGTEDPNFVKYHSPFERMNAIITAMLGSDEKVQLFVPINYDDRTYNNIDFGYASEHDKYSPTSEKGSASVNYHFTAKNDYPIYCYFPSLYPREVSLSLNGISIGRFFGNDSFCIKSLGSFSEGEKINLNLKLESDSLYIKNQQYYFYYLDEALFVEVMESLAECGYEIERFTEDHFIGTISVKEGRETIYTSIPFDQGWIVKVDGKIVDTFEALDALLAFDVEPGEHTLELRYMPGAFVKGVITTLASILIFILIVIGEYLIRRRRSKVVVAESTAQLADNPDIIPDAEIFGEIIATENNSDIENNK
ncbi:MAG: YfhO family protein [Clostridiales bacterium]|nr:YfhO family protein [Clostridiales bacterium]